MRTVLGDSGVMGFRVGLVLVGLLQGACGELAGASGGPPLSDDDARAVLRDLRARHQVANAVDVIPAAGPRRSVLGVPAPIAVERRGERFYVNRPETQGPELSLPSEATEAFSLRERASGVAVDARLVGARASTGVSVDGTVIYPKAGPNGGSIVHRIVEDGTEDYIEFETAPAESEVVYEVSLSSHVAGLRLVSDTLEFLDAEGFPRLRVAPPSIVGADGRIVDARLTVKACDVDTDGAPPWERAPISPGADVCEVRVGWDPASVVYPALLDPSWGGTGNMAFHRISFAAVKLSNGNVLVTGGYGNTGSVLSKAEIYNPAGTGTWATIPDMPTARADHTMTLRANNQVLITGGTNGTSDLSSIAIYRTDGTWATTGIPSMSQPRQRHAATLLANGDILVTGGTIGSPPSLSAQKFTTANAWVSAGTMVSYKVGHEAVRLTDGRVLVTGAGTPASEIYNPMTNTWNGTATDAEPRSFHRTVPLADGTVLSIGGMAGVTNQSTQLFSLSSGQTWTRTGNLWWNHVLHTATRLSNGRVVVIGGQGTTSRTATEIFNPTWGTWVPGPQLSTPRYSHVAVLLNSGKILIAGGIDAPGLNVLRSAALYDPATTATTATTYQLPASESDNDDVFPDKTIEFWASVHRPTTLASGTRYPVLLFMHGQHASCGENGTSPRNDSHELADLYCDTGACAEGFTIVENHRGYDYLTNELAARGYIVVSINASRGINCGYPPIDDPLLILPRARLFLKHLEKLSRWDRGLETTPQTIGVSLANRLDFSQVGLFGHSRGGQAARAAFKLYGEAGSPWPAKIVTPVNVRGIFEIGPTDCGPQDDMGCTAGPPALEARNTRWNVLLPQCDGDEKHLRGIRPFDRMFAQTETTVRPKSTFTVWGANHNYYNTEWQVADGSCADHRPLFTSGPGIIGSAEQRQTALEPVLAFFTGNVGASRDPWMDNVFNPEMSMTFEPRVDRGYSPGLTTNMSLMLEDFVNATGTSSYNRTNVHSSVNVRHVQPPTLPVEEPTLPLHDAAQRGGEMWWSTSGNPPYPFFQTNFTNPGSGLNLSSYQLLDIRVDRKFDSLNGESPTDFEVSLVGGNGVESARVAIGTYVSLLGPVGSNEGLDFPYMGVVPHSMLQTARIPLSRFTGVSLSSIRAVRFTFSLSVSGALYFANIRATKTTFVP